MTTARRVDGFLTLCSDGNCVALPLVLIVLPDCRVRLTLGRLTFPAGPTESAAALFDRVLDSLFGHADQVSLGADR